MERAKEWNALPAEDRDVFFKKFGVRWFEFARLPYFDPVRMTLIDPMHNLLMGKWKYHRKQPGAQGNNAGLVKTQWYSIWIKRNSALRASTDVNKRELDAIHEHLKLVRNFILTRWKNL